MAKVNLKEIDRNLIREKRGPGPSPVVSFCTKLGPDEAVPAADIAKKIGVSIDTVKRGLKDNKCRLYLPGDEGHEVYGAHPDTVKKYLK